MRIVIDIDGTICETKKPGQTYDQVRVTPGAVEKIKALKAAGHYIILQTARHMKTTGGDVKLVIEKVGAVTEKWLKDNGIVFDEIHFGKPYNQILIDDRCFWFEGWENFKPEDFDSNRINLLIDLTNNSNPFLVVKGKAKVEWAVKSFENLAGKYKLQLIFAVSQEQITKDAFDEQLKKLFGEQIIIVPAVSGGQLSLSAAIKKYVGNLQQLIVSSGDIFCEVPWHEALEDNVYGMLAFVVESVNGGYGYIKNDEWGFVSEISEKKPISNLASNGVYYFRCGRDFISCAKSIITRGEEGTIFCYNELVRRGQQVKAVKAEQSWDLSTQAALANFERNYH